VAGQRSSQKASPTKAIGNPKQSTVAEIWNRWQRPGIVPGAPATNSYKRELGCTVQITTPTALAMQQP
jgi:hypothetical protein